MRAIILAAGIGSRLGNYTNNNPKSMIVIGEKSLIHHQIDACLNSGITDFVFVLGYKENVLKQHILQKLDNLQAKFVINPKYSSTNTLHSLWLASQDYFDESFIYFNADVLFLKDLLLKINKENGKSELLLDSRACAEEEVKMILADDQTIINIGKKLNPEECAGEFIGVGKFDKTCLNTFKEKLKYGVDNSQSNNYFEYAVDLMAKEIDLFAVDTDGLPCIEIDFPEDLKTANELIYPKIQKIENTK